MTFLQRLGTLRSLLFGATLVCCPLVWWADSEPVGIGILTAYIVPSLVILLFFVLLLDALMNRIFMLEQSPAIQATRRFWLRSDLIMVALLCLCWIPFFRTIGSL